MEKRVCISQGPKQKAINRFSDRNLLRLIREWHCLNCFSALRQGLLCSSGAEHGKCSPRVKKDAVKKDQEDSFPLWRVVSLSPLRRRTGKSPCSSLEADHWELRGLWKGWPEGRRCLKHLTFVTIFPHSPSTLAFCNNGKN